MSKKLTIKAPEGFEDEEPVAVFAVYSSDVGPYFVCLDGKDSPTEDEAPAVELSQLIYDFVKVVSVDPDAKEVSAMVAYIDSVLFPTEGDTHKFDDGLENLITHNPDKPTLN